MKHELLFFERDIFYEYKILKQTEGYEIVSISKYLFDVNNTDLFSNFDGASQIIDLTALAVGYNEMQMIGEQILLKFPDDAIFIADKKHEEVLRYNLRYCFENFNNVEVEPRLLKQGNGNTSSGKPITSKYRRIIDLTDDELETFLQKFREALYGHEKFKDDFAEQVKNFRVFNKLGEHKILSFFLMGESGVGKTEVARTLHRCFDGKKKLAKVNFGNYSSEFSLSSLIGSARGYIGSEDGEIFIRVRDTDVGVILIDEFEKSNATLFNYFLDVLESGKIISSLAEEIDLNGFIIIFTSNISKENFTNKISPELRSRFDYKGLFTLLYNQDKKKFVEFRVKSIIKKYNAEFENKLNDSLFEYFVSQINVAKYSNMRDLNKKIKRAFVDYISIQTPEVLADSGSLRKFAKKIFGGN